MGYPPQPSGPQQPPGPYQPGPYQQGDPYQAPAGPHHGPPSGPQAGMPAGPPPYGPPQNPPPPPGGGGGNTGLIVALAIGAVVLLGVGAVVVFLLLPRGGPGPVADEFPEPPELEPLEEPLSDDPAGSDVAGDSPAIFPEFDGEWEGLMTQFDSSGNEHDTWVLTLDLASDATTATGELRNGSEHYCSWDLEVTYSSAALVEFDVVAIDREVSCVRESELALVLAEDDEIEAAWQGEFSSGELSLAGGLLYQ